MISGSARFKNSHAVLINILGNICVGAVVFILFGFTLTKHADGGLFGGYIEVTEAELAEEATDIFFKLAECLFCVVAALAAS